MSHYTTELRYVCETLAGLQESVGYNDVNSVIENSRDKLFNFDFPIYDENYRSVLETKIIKHYYTHEIGSETVGLFQFRLDTKLNEIMPYYNELYRSAMLEFNPLYDVDITETHEGSGEKLGSGTDNTENSIERETTGEGTGNNTNYNLYSSTPQGGLSGVDEEEYLTDARKITDASSYNDSENETVSENKNRTTSDTVTTTDEYIRTIKGKRGGASYANMILEYRKTLLNIDMMIIKELANLFMLIW